MSLNSDESPDIIPETLYHKIQKDFGRQSTDEQVGMLLLLNSKGINIALKQLEINHCAHILGKISQYFEYRMIFANSLYRIGEGKRLEILDIWKKADSVLYNRAITCLKLRESHILKNNELPTHIPEGYIFTGEFPCEFPETARECKFCGEGYIVGQDLLDLSCFKHSYHSACEAAEGSAQGCCPTCDRDRREHSLNPPTI